MNVKRLSGTLVAALIVAVAAANSASAAAVTENSQWNVAGAKLAAGASKEMTCKSTPRAGQVAGEKNIKFEGKVLGDPVVFTATDVECLPHRTNEATAKIEQVGNAAKDFTRLKFTGVTVDEPAGCVLPATITTEPLETEIFMEGTKVYDKYVPTEGKKWFTAAFTGCTIEGNFNVTGTTFGLFQHLNAGGATVDDVTGEERVEPMQTFSRAIDVAAGGGLTMGGEPLKFNATIDLRLAGGPVFGAQ